MVIVNDGHWIGQNGCRRSITGGLKSWQEQKMSELSDLGWVDQMAIRWRTCLKDNA